MSTATTPWRDLVEVDLDRFNADLTPSTPTADVAIHIPDTLHPAHAGMVSLPLLLDGLERARGIFAAAGVQLRLVACRGGHLDPALLGVHAAVRGDVPRRRHLGMYRAAQERPSRLSPEAEEAFAAIVPDEPGADRVVHLVVLHDVFMTFHEQLDERTWRERTISTGGLSFPGYMYGATMPRHLRGVITITDLTKEATSWKTVAHELGHKLLNVSHEYRDTAPAHEVRAEGGLMLYGAGTDIPAGREGRFHRERLHRSPFLHRTAADGTRVDNPDYARDGSYHDPIYDGLCIELDPS